MQWSFKLYTRADQSEAPNPTTKSKTDRYRIKTWKI